MKNIAIYGAGGFGREIACLIKIINEAQIEPEWNLVGFYDDDPKLKGRNIGYGNVLGDIEELNKYPESLSLAIAIGTPHAVKAVADRINNPKVVFPNLVAPSVSFLDKESVVMGIGNIISSSCLISCNVTFGDFNILNGFIPIGHDAKIGNYNVIMPSCNISGGVTLGEGNYLGVKAVILQNVKIGNDVRVGAGSVVMRNTKNGHLYLGNPARIEKL